MTVERWIDTNTDKLYGHRIRIIKADTHKGVGDMMMFYFDYIVKNVKITSKYIFIFI